MKTLLIAHYWWPYNNAGTFRWLYFSKYIDCDVMTTKEPCCSTFDRTIPNPHKKTIKFGKRLPAVLWGILASFRVLFTNYDRYIITSPPESLLLGAWLLQLIGKRVHVDMRDQIDRESQPLKIFIPVYKWLYSKIKRVTVCWKFIDETKPVVYHGYEQVEKAKFKGYYYDRVNHAEYIKRLAMGYIPDQSGKPKGYAASSLHTFKHLGYPVNHEFHKEFSEVEPKSYEIRAKEMLFIL